MLAAILGTTQQCIDPELNLKNDAKQSSEAVATTKAHRSGRVFEIVPMYLGYFTVTIGSSSKANIEVSWGDGTNNTYVVENYLTDLNHDYATISTTAPVISITGDLNKIIYFQTEYGSGTFAGIDFKHLTNLQEVYIDLTSTPAEIDLSHNKRLTKISVGGVPELQTLLLPKHHNISSIGIDGPSGLSVENIDQNIANIYANAVAKNITGGALSITKDWQNDEADLTMLGPPSSFSIDLLRSLQNDYGWTITPSLQ